MQGHNVDLMYSDLFKWAEEYILSIWQPLSNAILRSVSPNLVVYLQWGEILSDWKFWEFLKVISGNRWFVNKNKNAPSEIILPQFELVTQHPQDQSHSIVNT